jgi:hypothetical protein
VITPRKAIDPVAKQITIDGSFELIFVDDSINGSLKLAA